MIENEENTNRYLIRSSADDVLKDIDDLKFYGLPSYIKEILRLNKAVIKHNWTIEEALQIYSKVQTDKTISAANKDLIDINNIINHGM